MLYYYDKPWCRRVYTYNYSKKFNIEWFKLWKLWKIKRIIQIMSYEKLWKIKRIIQIMRVMKNKKIAHNKLCSWVNNIYIYIHTYVEFRVPWQILYQLSEIRISPLCLNFHKVISVVLFANILYHIFKLSLLCI